MLDVVFPGDSAEHFQNLPAPYNQDFLLDCFLKNAEYARYLNPDDLLQEDGSLVFNRGEAAAFEGTLGSGGTAAVQKQVCQNVPGAKVGFWSYAPAFTPRKLSAGSGAGELQRLEFPLHPLLQHQGRRGHGLSGLAVQ